MIKKIMLVASFKHSEPGPLYLESLRKTGYDPLCFDMKKENDKVYNRTRNPLIDNLVNPYVVRIMNNRLLSMVNKFKPDLVLVQKDLSIDQETIEEIKNGAYGQLHMFDGDFKLVEKMLLTEKTAAMAENS